MHTTTIDDRQQQQPASRWEEEMSVFRCLDYILMWTFILTTPSTSNLNLFHTQIYSK